MYCYKLFRLDRNGRLRSLFIDKSKVYQIDTWYMAESHPTKGFIQRPYFHCLEKPLAPHLSMKNRVWCKVEVKGESYMKRSKSQGGMWILANQIRIVEIL